MSSQLSDLLLLDSIMLDADVGDWTAAIRTAGQLLEAAGVTTENYTQSMIDNVDEHGPYIVVAPGFAFAHARPSEAVHRTGMSWVRLSSPVRFGHEQNDPVDLVVALAAQDSQSHTRAMADLARVLADASKRAALDSAETPEQVMAILRGDGAASQPNVGAKVSSSSEGASLHGAPSTPSSAAHDHHMILTVCGNGLGTSLFLKNTLEQVLDTWGWSDHLTVEATDTISARGRAKEATAILTSGEIARILGDVGVPVRVVENFTSTDELDLAMRDLYDV